jgi:threonine synthase
MASFSFRCAECRAFYREDEVRYTCPQCAREQRPGGVIRGVLEVVLDELPAAWPDSEPASPAFLDAFLPIASRDALPPLAVGGTPLLPVPELRAELEMPRLWLKDDGRNPSGSTKDRASLLVVAKAAEYGLGTIACASTGNAATALAAVAAAAGLESIVFVPAAAPRAKLVQMSAYGARVVRVDGSYDDAFELCRAACESFGWYNRNTALNPFTVEGKKTAALEIAAQLEPEVPDVIVVPTGDGVIISGVAKGFADLRDAGLVGRVPRLVSVQPSGSAAIARALAAGDDAIVPVSGAASVADSLTVEAPRNAILALRRIREFGGTGVHVLDDDIVADIGRLARTTGVFAEPAAAAALTGLRAALETGSVDRNERVVLLVTGSGLKDVPAAERAIRIPDPVAPDLDTVAAFLDRRGRM